MENRALTKVEDNGKRPLIQDIIESNTEDRKTKKPILAKEPILKIVELPTPNIRVAKDKSDNT